jgi:hypothetical protein
MEFGFREEDIRVIIFSGSMEHSESSHIAAGRKRTAEDSGSRTPESAPKRRKLSSASPVSESYVPHIQTR